VFVRARREELKRRMKKKIKLTSYFLVNGFGFQFVPVSEGGGEGFHLPPKAVFDFECVLVVDLRRFVFLPGAHQFYEGGIGLLVEEFPLLALGFIFGVEFGDGFQLLRHG
jgi:hypothetical protein